LAEDGFKRLEIEKNDSRALNGGEEYLFSIGEDLRALGVMERETKEMWRSCRQKGNKSGS